jgi:hypothetical protein
LIGGSPLTDANGDPGKEKNAGARRAWPLFVGLPLIILIAVAAVAFSGTKERASQPAGGQPPGEKGSAEQRSQADKEQASGGKRELGHPALGEEGAPVVMIEYGDYQ